MVGGARPASATPHRVLSLPIDVHVEALDKLDESATWCESRRPGLGFKFAAEIERVIGAISESLPGPNRAGTGPESETSHFFAFDRFIAGLAWICATEALAFGVAAAFAGTFLGLATVFVTTTDVFFDARLP